MLADNWLVTRRIKEPSPGNHSKFYISPLPHFHEENFPFLICSGRESINLIDIKNIHTEPLIKASVYTDVFFTLYEKNDSE